MSNFNSSIIRNNHMVSHYHKYFINDYWYALTSTSTSTYKIECKVNVNIRPYTKPHCFDKAEETQNKDVVFLGAKLYCVYISKESDDCMKLEVMKLIIHCTNIL